MIFLQKKLVAPIDGFLSFSFLCVPSGMRYNHTFLKGISRHRPCNGRCARNFPAGAIETERRAAILKRMDNRLDKA